MNIQHSSRTDRWGTPPDVIILVKQVLGEIDLDPASEAAFNALIGANHYYTQEMDALSIPEWHAGSLYCNPPGGKRGNRSMTQLFWDKLMTHRDTGRLTHAIFMCFSLEAAQTTQRDNRGGILRFPLCVPSHRLRFLLPDGSSGQAPAHSNAIVYVPGSVDMTDKFVNTFRPLGMTTRGVG